MTFFFSGGIVRWSKEDGFQSMSLILATANSTRLHQRSYLCVGFVITYAIVYRSN